VQETEEGGYYREDFEKFTRVGHCGRTKFFAVFGAERGPV